MTGGKTQKLIKLSKFAYLFWLIKRLPCCWPLSWWSWTPPLTTNVNITRPSLATTPRPPTTEERPVTRLMTTTALTDRLPAATLAALTIPATTGANPSTVTARPATATRGHSVTIRPPSPESLDFPGGIRSPVSDQLNR